MKKAPIVSLHYKRPAHTLQALKSLSENYGADQSELFIFCDDARNEADKPLVHEVRKIAKSQRWCGEVHVVERPHNLGLFENSVSAISQICEQYGRMIFLEDDSLLSPVFLNYMNNALDRYEDCSEVVHVSGYTWPVNENLPETFFLRTPNVWGWGTWQRAWQHYKADAAYWLKQIDEQQAEQEISYGGTRPYVQQLKQILQYQTRNSWSIYWLPAVFFNGLALYPKQSLVHNIGFDGTGENYKFATSVYDTVTCCDEIIQFPDVIAENEEAKIAFIQYFQSLQPKNKPLLQRGMHRIHKTLKSLHSFSKSLFPMQAKT
jgi:GT2 family glycosyltransferase